MTDTPKRFCKDCRHLDVWFTGPCPNSCCSATTKTDPVMGEVVDRVMCRERNKGLDCALFEEFQPPPVYAPVYRRPWWRFWE